MKELTLKNLMFACRLMSCSKKNHAMVYLLALYYKKDLSVDDMALYMAGMYTANGQAITRRHVYSKLYALDKQGYVYSQKDQGENGGIINVYYLTPKGRQEIADVINMIENWDQWSHMIETSTKSLFGVKPSALTKATR